MNNRTRLAALAVLGLTVLGMTPAATATATATATAAPSVGEPAHTNGSNDLSNHGRRRVCTDKPGRDQGSCGAIIDTTVTGPLAAGVSAPSGYSPGDLAAAYNLPTGAGSGRTIAIVDAFDLPTAQNDLNTYRAQYGLPPCGPGCFTKVNQDGGSALPPANAAWGQEIALDMDMASAACPNCRILLVEAASTSLNDLGASVNTAVRLGAVAVSNSYGGTDGSSDNYFDSQYFNHPGVAITASSGDSGFGVQYPASSPYVTAVGGTSLTRSPTARGFSESAWSGAGSGCSAFEPKPTWQRDGGCSGRTVADVSAVADPATGVAVYDSTPNNGQSGWLVFGGTSAAAPLVAGAYALAGSAGSGASSLYANRAALNDVTTGSNGACGNYLCNGVPGYDGPTGLGTPNGVGAFSTGQSPIAAHYTALGGAGSFLGTPVSGEYTVAGGREVDYQGGSIYYTPATGAFSVHGAIRDRYNALGGPAGFLGFPTTDETATPDGVGRYNHFANAGSIYWTPAAGAQSVHGAIRDRWASMGWEAGPMGYPVTDESGTPDGVGRYNHFTGGYGASIYWTPATGAQSVQGAIRARWAALGWEAGPMGYPTTDETPTPNGVGRYNHFAGGGGASIYWTPATGAQSVQGAIRARWAAQGWEAGSLGFPTTDEYAVAGGRASSFQGGTLTYSYASGMVTRS